METGALLTLTDSVQTGSNIGNPVPLPEENSSNKRERERENSNSKTLFSKDCSLGSFRPV